MSGGKLLRAPGGERGAREGRAGAGRGKAFPSPAASEPLSYCLGGDEGGGGGEKRGRPGSRPCDARDCD